MGVQDEQFLSGDEKTLRLSVPVVTTDLLEKVVAFQRRFVFEAERSADRSEAAIARMHQEAIDGSGLPPKLAGELEAVVRAFTGRRWTLRALERRLLDAQLRVEAGKDATAKDLLLVQKLPAEIRARSEPGLIEKRLPPEALAWLQEREEELLGLHEKLGAFLRTA